MVEFYENSSPEKWKQNDRWNQKGPKNVKNYACRHPKRGDFRIQNLQTEIWLRGKSKNKVRKLVSKKPTVKEWEHEWSQTNASKYFVILNGLNRNKQKFYVKLQSYT